MFKAVIIVTGIILGILVGLILLDNVDQLQQHDRLEFADPRAPNAHSKFWFACRPSRRGGESCRV